MRIDFIASLFSQTAYCHNAQIPKHALNLQKKKGSSAHIAFLNGTINCNDICHKFRICHRVASLLSTSLLLQIRLQMCPCILQSYERVTMGISCPIKTFLF